MLLTIKYKFNYQMIIIHSPHYEQELLSIIILIFSIKLININCSFNLGTIELKSLM